MSDPDFYSVSLPAGLSFRAIDEAECPLRRSSEHHLAGLHSHRLPPQSE